ncbi:LAGLIDADG family homing endonuclease [Alicyclobacillus acidoterrestris]|uniref:Uncharacterized protein n=1 Tax=Alicyclobacillus acidoterrestris (strain ATCC 49025 / DSM 3922 / CIP 106132 / NCIMB 13137 / GD3B) TaxID=1356854 RepID=T0C408_ALIAG|nr:hypothetical protein [Alicyclobacillus acidoterrestris]EPZ47749.1 hypothetical protein N007_05700 [Alicyclobacillus acidoterrestris ATCC 49025]UNO47946.1 hypothetical protein K1I37_14825 [Alicyclobacillus acidoterrestris]
MGGKPFTEQEINYIIDLHLQGYSTVEIERLTGRNNTSIGRLLERNGYKRWNKKRHILLNDIQTIIEMYAGGQSTKQIGSQFNITGNTVASILRENGIAVRPRGQACQIENEHFFDTICSEAQAYFLGLIITDGSIVADSKGRKTLSIMLKEEDGYILNEFARHLGLPKDRVKISNRNEAYVRTSSAHLIDSLAQYGVIPRKTFSTYLPMLYDTWMPHLIRGIFDGDGSVFTTGGRIKVAQYGTHRLCDEIQQYLNIHASTSVRNVFDKPTVSFIQYTTRSDIANFYKYIYSDATIFLTRKKEKFGDDMPTPR